MKLLRIDDVIDKAARAIAHEVDSMTREFDKIRSDHDAWIDWWEFECAGSLRGTSYTLVPPDFYERLARAALRTVAPCLHCKGLGHEPIVPDFIGDDPKTMKTCTMSACQHCSGSGIDPDLGI